MTALLLHGQPGGADDWQWVQRELGTRVPSVAVDRPGYLPGTSPGGIRHSAEAAVARLDALGIERAIVVGHSYGGAVAAWLGAFHADRVAGLVLVAAAANTAALERFDDWLAAPVIGPALSAGWLWGGGLATQVPPVRRYMAGRLRLPESYVAHEGRINLHRRSLKAFVVEQRQLLVELPELEPALGEISAPTTVMVGTHDGIVPPAAGRLLSEQIPDATLVEVLGNHILIAQHPAAVAAEIAAMAERVAARA